MQYLQEAVAQNQDAQKNHDIQLENLKKFNSNCLDQISNLKEEVINLKNERQQILNSCKAQLCQLEQDNVQKLAEQERISEATILQLNNEIKRLSNSLGVKEQIIREKDSEIEKLENMRKETGKELQRLRFIELNYQYSNNTAQSNQSKSQTSNSMIIEGQNRQKENYNYCMNYNEKDLTLEHYVFENNRWKQELDNVLSKSENQKKISNRIEDQQKIINEKNEIFANISGSVDKLKKNLQQEGLLEDLNKIQELTIQGRKEISLNKFFKCCKGQYEIVYCQQKQCMYHLNCLSDKVISQGQLTLNNCDCNQPFPYQLLRRMNFVEAKCLLENILEGQQKQLLSEIVKSKKFLVYKCPNLFCSFEWCFRPNNQSLNTGSLSYCPNCQMIVQSELKVG